MLDMEGQHAEEDMRLHPGCRPVKDWSDFKINGFKRTEGTLNLAEAFVGGDGLRIAQCFGWQIGANDIEAIEGGLFCNVFGLAVECEAVFFDGNFEVLGHLVPMERH